MKRYWNILVALVLAGGASVAMAQDATVPPTSDQAATEESMPVSPSAKAFSELLKRAEETLKQSSSYRVAIDARWSLLKNGVVEKAGQNHLTFLSAGAKRLRIEGREGVDQPAQLTLVADGEQLTKGHAATRQFSVETVSDAREALTHCNLAQALLEICGVQILLSPEPGARVASQLVQLVDLGDDHDSRHFRLGLQDGREVDVWFSDAPPYLPSKLTMQNVQSLSQDWKQELQIETDFNWELNPTVSDSNFQFSVPEGWSQVRSLSQTLRGLGVEPILSQPLPNLQLTNLAGQPFSVDQETRPVLLYFWATWAAPSSERLPEIVEFSKQLEQQGVKVIAVNVAEPVDRITEFLKLNKLETSVAVDRDGVAVHALHLSELPAVVLIGKDHCVQAIHQSIDQSIRPLLLQQLEALSNGEAIPK